MTSIDLVPSKKHSHHSDMLCEILMSFHPMQMLLVSLEAVAGNLLGQLGALSAEQTRKATILQGH